MPCFSDLHAVDAKYHTNCYLDFVNVRNIKAVQNHINLNNSDEEPSNYVLKVFEVSQKKFGVPLNCWMHALFEAVRKKSLKYFVSRPKALQLFWCINRWPLTSSKWLEITKKMKVFTVRIPQRIKSDIWVCDDTNFCLY